MISLRCILSAGIPEKLSCCSEGKHTARLYSTYSPQLLHLRAGLEGQVHRIQYSCLPNFCLLSSLKRLTSVSFLQIANSVLALICLGIPSVAARVTSQPWYFQCTLEVWHGAVNLDPNGSCVL